MTSLKLDYFQTINIMFILLLDVACIMQMFQFSNAMKCNRSKMIQRDSEGEFWDSVKVCQDVEIEAHCKVIDMTKDLK